VGKPILLLRLEGPLQSWGQRSRWDVRETNLEPTKSGVLGLIGCAMGIGRNNIELEKFDQNLLFGVRVESHGVISTDYHTVSGYHLTASGYYKHSGVQTVKNLSKAQEHKENVIVSHRDYIQDAAFLACLALKHEHDDYTLLESMEKYLQNPIWPIYLGRKCCVPSRPIFERLSWEYNCIEDALIREPLRTPISGRHKIPERLKIWIECESGHFERQDALRVNYLRNYEFRRYKRIDVESSLIRRMQ